MAIETNEIRTIITVDDSQVSTVMTNVDRSVEQSAQKQVAAAKKVETAWEKANAKVTSQRSEVSKLQQDYAKFHDQFVKATPSEFTSRGLSFEETRRLLDRFNTVKKAREQALGINGPKVTGTPIDFYGPRSRDTQLSPQVQQLRQQSKEVAEQWDATKLAIGSAVGAVTGFIAAYGGMALANLFSSSVESARQYSDVMRQLSSASTDAGVSFSYVRDVNTRLAESFKETRASTAALSGELAELLNKAGKIGELENYGKGLADIAAGRGLSVHQVSGILQAANQGNLQSLKGLGVNNINRELREYSRTLKIAVADLTDYEKAQLAVNLVQQKFSAYAGQAALESQTLSGAQRELSTALSEMMTNLGAGLSENGTIRGWLNILSEGFKSLVTDIDEVNKKLREGMSPKEITDDLHKTPSAWSYAQAGATALTIGSLYPFAATGMLGDALKNAVSPSAINEREAIETLSRITATAQLLNKQEEQANREKNENIEKDNLARAEREERRALRQFQTRLSREVGNAQTSFARLEELRKEAVKRMSDPEYAEQLESVQHNISEAIKRSIEQAKSQIKSAVGTYKSTFQSLVTQVNSDNPFVNVFIQARNQIDKLKEDIKGLPVELQKAALAMQRAVNARELFNTRVDSAMNAQNYRDIAENFRNPFDQEKANEDRARWEMRFLRDNPNYLNRMRQEYDMRNRNMADPTSILMSFEDWIKKDLDRRAEANPLLDSMQRRNVERLDRQFSALDRVGATSASERAIIDERIVRLAGSLDPSSLRADQRERVAQSAERLAEREERRHGEAMKVYNEQLKTQKAIAAYQEVLAKVADKQGAAGVKQALEITVKDETSTGVETQQPTPQISAAYYSGQVLYQGWYGQLTNR